MVVLILAPHTDDGELGCGGSIVKHIENGDAIYYIAFSKCIESVPEGLSKDILVEEMYNATNTLGIRRENIYILDYPVRRFGQHRQDILEDIIAFREKIKPQIVYAPSIHDTHQDHIVIAEEVRRAFKNISIYGYEEPWNNFVFENQHFNVLKANHLKKKLSAINCYKSQHGKMYFNKDFIFGQAKYHGVQVGKEYAEIFEVIRQVIE